MDGQITSPSPPNNPDSDVMSEDSFGGSDGDSKYIELAKNSSMSSANTPDLEGHISELEKFHKVLEGQISTIVQLMMILSHTDKL